ncbi:MAG: hypothetical protein GY909_08385 [Oligoflexia bacterium]|nr:hypothetical protein [Oligoflexia bacterium]
MKINNIILSTCSISGPLAKELDDIRSQAQEKYPHFSEDRLKQWLLGRGLVAETLKENFSQAANPLELEQENFEYINALPDFTYSLSHSKKSLAMILTKRSDYLNIGLDIEDEKRIFKEGMEKYFVHDDDLLPDGIAADKKFNYLWSIKEACFKALFPFVQGETPFVLTDVWINKNQFGFKGSTEVLGEWEEIKESYDSLAGHIVIIAKVLPKSLKPLIK